MSDTYSSVESAPASVPPEHVVVPASRVRDKMPAERSAPDPTRYGDWEKNGRCIDF
ncbi:DUF1674 domain-containing protein [Rhodanobacter umsongensis]|uniref:DUF1674 domain-containing protein n=1 Tax=Rhodanobacter umsongensis TaxID=633153 RepID=A0ABW0JHL6_9GAMM